MTGEQLTADLAGFGQRMGQFAGDLPVKNVQKLLFAVLGLWLLYIVAQLVWVALPVSNTVAQAPGEQAAGSLPGKPEETVDIEALQALNLFGEAGAVPIIDTAPVVIEENIDATKTRLSLNLEGIAMAPREAESVAIIVYQNKQEQYHIGDTLPAGNRVILAKVLSDHVILDNNGNYESLWLYDDEKAGQQAAGRSKPTVASSKINDKRNNNRVTSLARDYKERLYKNPASLAEVLRISPAQRDGELIGYRVSAGRDRDQFAELGFQANDVVTSVNGISLDEPSNALEIYKLMRNAKEAAFTVERDGDEIEIMVALDE